MSQPFDFTVKRIRFDENYQPSDNTRITTNFANLARGPKRQENLRHALRMIDQRFNALAHWDNPRADRYSVQLDIVTVEMRMVGDHSQTPFPAIEMLETAIVDHQTGQRIDGLVGNNFSSYVRDYDFSVLLPQHNQKRAGFSVPERFGELHGSLFQHFVNSPVYRQHFSKPPVICLSVSENKTYQRTGNQHPVLGFEYLPDEPSLTEVYFRKMGMQVRYFMPPHCNAPLAFYFFGDLLNDYSNLELIGTVSTMETFQRIYRPEIYNSNAVAGSCYRPSLKNQNYSVTHIVYDREERSRLAVDQGKFAEEHFIKPYQAVLQRWLVDHAQ
jgi:hypothetical protein